MVGLAIFMVVALAICDLPVISGFWLVFERGEIGLKRRGGLQFVNQKKSLSSLEDLISIKIAKRFLDWARFADE